MKQDEYSAVEAAGLLGVSERTIRRAIQRGELPAEKQGRSFLIDRQDLASFQRRYHPSLPLEATGPGIEATHGSGSSTALLIGREREVAAASELLRDIDTRLLTICGPGGVGKTRLSQELMQRIGADFRDAAVFVPLATITSAGDVPASIMMASHLLPGRRSPAEAVLEVFRERESLLILDNFEHVAEARDFVQELLESAPSIVILTTSRQPLGLDTERVFELEPLRAPDPAAGAAPELRRSAPAVRLFVDRARRIVPSFTLTAENARPIGEIVRRLDGLPLGIELVAPLVASQTPDVVLERLETRLPLLIGGSRNAPSRHQTLHQTIDWSFRLLLPAEQEAFLILSNFVASFDIELAGAALSGLELDPDDGVQAMIDNLVSKSLVARQADGRFLMLQTIRDFAHHHQGLTESLDCNLRIAAHFASQADVFDRERTSRNQKMWLAYFRREIENVRASLHWSLSQGHQDLVLRIATGMVLYWASSGYFGEGLDWVERGLAMNGKLDPEAYLRAVSRAGYLAKFKGDEAKTRAYLGEALVLAESSTDVRERCEIYDNVSDFAHDNGDYDRARALQQRLVDESRELPDQSLHAIGLSGLGITCLATGDLAGDREYQERAYEIACSADDARRRARIAINLGVVYRYLNDLEMAEARYLEAERLYGDIGELNMMQATALNRSELALTMNQLERCQELSREIIAGAREIGNLRRETIATANLGLASIQLGQDREGFEILAKASSMALRQGAKPLIVEFLNAAAAEFTERGEMQRAATIFGSAASVARELGFVVSDEAQAMVRQAVRTCQAALGAEAFEKATARGAQMPLEDVVRLSEGPFRDAASDAPVDPASLGAITARERDVLRLLAEGLTDQQIADQLFLSKRTVSTHVASILAKLDVDSRTAAASAAIRNGLIA